MHRAHGEDRKAPNVLSNAVDEFQMGTRSQIPVPLTASNTGVDFICNNGFKWRAALGHEE